MREKIQEVHQVLGKLTGAHRRLLDIVRAEKQALIEANVKTIQEHVYAKQSQIELIRQAELERLRLTGELAIRMKKPMSELTLPNLIILVQGDDAKAAEQLRTSYNVLVVLVQRITEQNNENRALVEKSLEHVQQMKKNVLGETAPRANTYNPQGQKSNNGAVGSRFLSKEA